MHPGSRCSFGKLVVSQFDRRTSDRRFREVDTRDGKKPVSVRDGYRMIVSYPNGSTFANIKIEWSEAAAYTEDRKAVVANMEYMASRGSLNLQRGKEGNFDLYEIDDAPARAPQGLYLLLDDSRQMIVTTYLFNESKEPRMFGESSRYQELRKQFLAELASCVLKAGSAP